MSHETTISDSVVIPGVSPEEVYAQVADPTQMGRWSRENTGAVVDGERGSRPGTLAVGDTFVGSNQRGSHGWRTRCRVTAADPGERFTFDVVAFGLGTPRLKVQVATWDYAFEAVDGGTRVTETWHDLRRWPDALKKVVDPRLTGGRLFPDHQRRNIRRTLDAMRDDLAVEAR